jgi:transposase InsO family protein
VREHLRACFEQWGLPKAIRVDNGDPWATQSDIPSALALWLVGLGVKVLLNRPRVSTDNGIVERGHGVLAHWVEAHKAQHQQDFQAQLDWATTMQRERYPALERQNRLQA